MTIKAVGLINTIFGLKLYILYKIKGTFNISHLANKGQKNIIILIFITCVVYAAVIFYYLKHFNLFILINLYFIYFYLLGNTGGGSIGKIIFIHFLINFLFFYYFYFLKNKINSFTL